MQKTSARVTTTWRPRSAPVGGGCGALRGAHAAIQQDGRWRRSPDEVAVGVVGDEAVPLVERDRSGVVGLDVEQRRGGAERGAPVEDLRQHGGGQPAAPLGRVDDDGLDEEPVAGQDAAPGRGTRVERDGGRAGPLLEVRGDRREPLPAPSAGPAPPRPAGRARRRRPSARSRAAPASARPASRARPARSASGRARRRSVVRRRPRRPTRCPARPWRAPSCRAGGAGRRAGERPAAATGRAARS